MWSGYWYFPGDPPIFDLLFDVGIVLSACGAAASLLMRRRKHLWARIAFGVAILVLFIGTAGVLPGAIVIGYRHGSAWGEVRGAIREYGARITAAAGSRSSPLSREEFDALRQRYVPTPVVLQLQGWGPVKLRMAHGVPPYVGHRLRWRRTRPFRTDHYALHLL
jgi:hypothetical protein